MWVLEAELGSSLPEQCSTWILETVFLTEPGLPLSPWSSPDSTPSPALTFMWALGIQTQDLGRVQ